MMHRYLATALLVAVLGVAGCGGGSETLGSSDAATVASFNASIAACTAAGAFQDAYSEAAGLSCSSADVTPDLDRVVEIARRDPDAVYEDSDGERTMRQVLSDAASEVAPHNIELSLEIDRAVSTLE